MSAEDNVKVIQAIYEAFGRGDVPALLVHLDSSVEWEVPAMPGVAVGGKYKGPDGVARFFQELGEGEDIQTFEPRDWLTSDDGVAIVGRAAGFVRSTGKHFDLTFVHVFKLRDGKVVSFRDFYDSHVVAAAYQP